MKEKIKQSHADKIWETLVPIRFRPTYFIYLYHIIIIIIIIIIIKIAKYLNQN